MAEVLFLLGSGISRDAGMPMVGEITDQVVSGEGAFLHSSGVFAVGADDPNYEMYRPPVEPVLALLRRLRSIACSYFEREPTYEEIAQTVGQLHDSLAREYESAAAEPLIHELLDGDKTPDAYRALMSLAGQAHDYINDTVAQLLSKEPRGVSHLDTLMTYLSEAGDVDIATLNHDLVLESALQRAGVSYSDGFERSDHDVWLWTDTWAEPGIRLMKLHGSLDWWGYQLQSQPWRGSIVGRSTGDDPIHPNHPDIESYPADLRPIILTGTFDKILSYESWIFPDQHLRFHQALRETDRLVSIGYGFGDKAINTRLIAWLSSALEHRLHVFHGKPDELFARARGAIQLGVKRWGASGQLAVEPKWVTDISTDDLAAIL